ncbi:MAG TPA: Rne/Rng family ribonuclease, partial [Terracidiphilus sp.]|nr:Rne/Rng family ribonuclease [Terracidiphilus sp.]
LAETAGAETESQFTQSSEISGETTPQSGDEAGARRWRGRRRRRGGRSQSEETSTEASSRDLDESPESEPIMAEAPRGRESGPSHVIRAQATPSDRPERAPSFVLPGESLSTYGAKAADDEPKAAAKTDQSAAAPARALTSRPSTLIEAPLKWDGSGLLPGESLSRHRNPAPEPVHESAHGSASEYTSVEEEAFEPAPAHEGHAHHASHEFAEEELVEEQLAAPETAEEFGEAEDESEIEEETTEPEPDSEASHRVDPNPPTGFRLFGIGGRKKRGDGTDEPTDATSGQARPTTTSVSAFAPGSGLIEEEVIEGEEYEIPGHPHSHRVDEQDLDEYEEQTLQSQIRSGAIGEMLEEAQLEHRIELDDNNGDEEEDSTDEDTEEAEATGRPATAPGQPRRDRGTRGRRGRSPQTGGNRRGPSRRSAQTSDLPIISDLLKPNQEILVQIAKEPIAKKGARITSHIALPGRFLVFMPTVSHIGVSRKIDSEEERHRLKRILVSERGEASGGFIVRTAAEGASEEELRADLRFLIHLWNEIKQRSESSKSPALIYHDLSLIERILRDQVSADFASIWVDSQDDYERIVRFLNRFSPSLVRRVKLYTKQTPLFEHFGIQDEISKALRSKVWLKSGGSIVINQTEALVAIDINTGKYVGKSARLEDTIVKTNLDAVPEIVRQIRLRDLGGIIIIDFIDMDERKNRHRVMAALEEALKSDRAPTKVLQFNDFGLVAITRKRVKQSLERTLSVPCPVCQATGMVKSPATVCNEIYIELRKMRKHFENADVLLRVHPETVKVLKSNNARWLTEFEELVDRNILVKSDATLHPEQFDIQG